MSNKTFTHTLQLSLMPRKLGQGNRTLKNPTAEPNECPLSGHCLRESVIYQATVKTEDAISTALTENTFKSCEWEPQDAFQKQTYK